MKRLILLVMLLVACDADVPPLLGTMNSKSRDHLWTACSYPLRLHDTPSDTHSMLTCEGDPRGPTFYVIYHPSGWVRTLGLRSKDDASVRADFERVFAPMLPEITRDGIRDSIAGPLDDVGERPLCMGMVTKETATYGPGAIEISWDLRTPVD